MLTKSVRPLSTPSSTPYPNADPIPDVTTMSGSGSRSASNGASKNLSANNASAAHSKNRASRSARAAWVPSNSGKSKAYVETLASQNRDHDDAASDNSERAIVVKTTVDVSGSSKF